MALAHGEQAVARYSYIKHESCQCEKCVRACPDGHHDYADPQGVAAMRHKVWILRIVYNMQTPPVIPARPASHTMHVLLPPR